MTLKDIETRIANIEAVKDYDEEAHIREDALYLDFIRHVAATASEPLKTMAARVLKVDAMNFSRWYA